MRRLKPEPVVRVGLIGLSVLLCVIILAGCGSRTPSNFAATPQVQVPAELASAVAAWVQAQAAGDEDALKALYDPDYSFNGMTADDMAEVRILPETSDTLVDTIRYQFIPVTDHHYQQLDHRQIVRARVTAIGQVAADYIRHLASGEPPGHEHHHDMTLHSHTGEQGQPLVGRVRARATCDVEWQFDEENGQVLIAKQRLVKGILSLGGGVSSPLLDHVHVHPDTPHTGEEIEVHGQYAALPPAGMIHVSIGSHQGEAILTAGGFEAHIEAPHQPGGYVVRVEASGGSPRSRTAALTAVEKEVTVQ